MKTLSFALLFSLAFTYNLFSQQTPKYAGKFEQLGNLIVPPSPYRTASGAPGKEYWQQRADYQIKVEIDESSDMLIGEERITYFNNSPDDLSYLWIQLDQNINMQENEDFSTQMGSVKESESSQSMQMRFRVLEFDAGVTDIVVTGEDGRPLKFIVNNTMMRVNLSAPVMSGSNVTFNIKWKYPITNRANFALSREGYDYFPEDDNKVYLLGHWFPRLAAYSDTEGWHTKQFQRLGEFALEFGDYDVEITVPADHIVASTGELTNPKEVLSKVQMERFAKAKASYDSPVMIVTPEEASENEKQKSRKMKTWKYRAENVRDVAFASSRKFIWDAQAVKLPTNTVMAMSYYPKEGLPVWSEESTKAVKNALEVYSEATFDYPYPVAISVSATDVGIEYPMICFNLGRPENGVMSPVARSSMIAVIVHEVGHNWFPMIVNNDERQWMWMDEGINTYFHAKVMEERYKDEMVLPGFTIVKPKDIVPFMSGDLGDTRPVMIAADNLIAEQSFPNYYAKPAASYTILRESVMGPELFDMALKEYANRWKFKRPNPADFFRSLEDATATDLDWFWRGWFFTTDKVDMDLANVKWFKVKEDEVSVENKSKTVGSENMSAQNVGQLGGSPEMISMLPSTQSDYGQFLSRLDEGQIRENLKGKNIYELTIKNKGGLVMPIVISWNYTDGTSEIETLPAEVWRHNEAEVIKTFMKAKEVASVTLDPNFQLADTETSNNTFPRQNTETRLEQFKKKSED